MIASDGSTFAVTADIGRAFIDFVGSLTSCVECVVEHVFETASDLDVLGRASKHQKEQIDSSIENRLKAKENL